MKTYYATTKINASPETVWRILTDSASYPAWDPIHTKIEGRIALGEKIVIHHHEPRQPRILTLTVSEFEPLKRMVWTGGGMPEAVFKGDQVIDLNSQASQVDVSIHLEFSGAMAPLMTRCIPDPTPDLSEFVSALKRRAEIESDN